MIFRNTFLAKRDVALRTNESRIFFLLIQLEIQSTAVICRRRDMASIRSAARSHRDLQRLRVKRIKGGTRDVVTTQAAQIGMLSAFMPESSGGNTPAPFAEHRRVSYAHGDGQLGIEVGLYLRWPLLWRGKLMTQVAVGGQRRNSRIGAMTGETDRVTSRRRLERALLQPESITDILRRLGHIFFARIALRLISLVTHGTALWRSVLFLFLKRHRHEPIAIFSQGRRVEPNHIDVLVVRETNAEFRNEGSSLDEGTGNVTETGKQPATGILRAVFDVTVCANHRRWSFTRKELFAMTI